MVDSGAVERRKTGGSVCLAPTARKSRAIWSVFDKEFSPQNRISNRNWPKNRSYRKQTSKPRLTGTRIDIRHIELLAHSFTQRSGFYKWSRPLLIDSDTPIEFVATRRKQTREKFLTGARTHISNFTFSRNSVTQTAPKFATLRSHRRVSSLGESDFDGEPVRMDRSCPIERIAREARGCGRWNRVGSIRTAHRSLGHADQ
jgi:hypothetical protein